MKLNISVSGTKFSHIPHINAAYIDLSVYLVELYECWELKPNKLKKRTVPF